MGETTLLLYLRNTYQFESEANILDFGQNDKGSFMLLNQTIFHPQGGGQPSDVGNIEIDCKTFFINFVGSINGVVHHYYTGNDQVEVSELIGKTVKLKVDSEERLNHAKSHTSGHLLSCVVEKLAPELKGLKGYHFPEGSYVEFQGKLSTCTNEELIKNSAKLMQAAINNQAEVSVNELLNGDEENSKKLRTITIDGYEAIPCGGTHLKNISELKEVTIRKIQSSKGNTKISYSFL